MEDCQLWLRPRIERYSLASSGCSARTIRPTGPFVLELPNMGNHNVKLMASLSRRITTKTFRVLEKTMPYLIENYTPFMKQLQEWHLVLEETDQLPIGYQMSMFSKLSIMIWVLQTHEVMRLGGPTAIHHKTRHRQYHTYNLVAQSHELSISTAIVPSIAHTNRAADVTSYGRKTKDLHGS